MEDGKKIVSVKRFSPAKKAGLVPGDTVVAINGETVRDVFDYRFLCCDTHLEIEAVTENGEKKRITIDKDELTDIGAVFSNPMMAEDRHCENNCVFCFINQMPKGMRDTLYFKDDDMGLSFLTGSYVTLTNCPDEELERIAKYHMSPINVSIHTLRPELRVKMLKNKYAGDVERKILFLLENGITVNGQIVLCPGVNDGEELKYTFDRMLKFPENFASCSIVPVGLTKFRDGLPELRAFTTEDALSTIRLVEDYAKMAEITRGTRLFYASDELYLKAELPIPDYDAYDGFPQLENGVGMLRLLLTETEEYLKALESDSKLLRRLKKLRNKTAAVTVATGELAGDEISEIAKKVSDLCKKFGFDLKIKVYCIENRYFGPEITVAGLLTGQDIIEELGGRNLGDRLLLSTNMFKSDADVFLDGVTLETLSERLGVRAMRVGKDGRALVEAMIFGE